MALLLRLTALVALSLSQNVHAATVSATLNVSNAMVAPDGFSRSAVVVNNEFPGPLITGNKGDTFEINVINSLTNNQMQMTTSIHWHGIYQNGTNWADGVAMVTQCPIVPGNSFLYNFQVDQAGTFWYHSHMSTQYCDGLRGAFVVYDPQDPNLGLYDVDNASTIITLGEWNHMSAPLGPKFPTPNGTVFNGIGQYDGGPPMNLAVITVVPGKRYRFRLISISCDPNYIFTIDGHNFTIIEVDAENTVPVTVDSLQIFAGQRYSFVLTANQPVTNYWIRAFPNIGITGFLGDINTAILRYQGAPAVNPLTNATSSQIPLSEQSLTPLQNPAAPGNPYPGGADVNLNLAMNFDGATQNFSINGYSFVPPTVPVLLQILSGAQTVQQLIPSGNIYSLPPNKTIEISLPGGAIGGPHPFHLHGHSFSVVRSAGNSTYNYANPPRRDVVANGQMGDNVTIRFTTNNPGPWFLHCHIDYHLETGLAVIFAEDFQGINATDVPPTAWNSLCPAYNNFIG